MIIGAGISGLICATELQRSGLSVQLIDKGRGFGGRMATRRMGDARLDHGAQYFTVRSPTFQRYVDVWLTAGIIKEWFRHLPGDHNPDGYPRYCGINGMTDVPRYLAQSLQIHRSEQACSLNRTSEGWEAITLSGTRFAGRQLVMTAPLPQAMALIDTSGAILPDALRAIEYEKGMATLAILAGPSGLPAPGGIKMDDGNLSWIADNQMKGISPDVPAITLHATASFAERHWDSPDAVRGPLMLEAAAPFLRPLAGALFL
jgi:predicted NAD/FAD-dependent oxidoreductase